MAFNRRTIVVVEFLQVDDCSEAYERFKPAVQSNLKDRVQCLELRGKSLMELGYKQHGQAELNVAAGLV